MGNEKKSGEVQTRDVKKEVKDLKTQPAKWTYEPTAFDHLPEHEKPFNIEPFPGERQRLPFKMTDEDRLRRKKWVESQALSEREPVRVPELEKILFNPFRRFYRLPGDKLGQMLVPIVGPQRAIGLRWIIPKIVMGYFGCLTLWYAMKYNNRTWEARRGWTIVSSQPRVFPGEPVPAPFKNEDYYDNGFQSRKVFKGSDYAY